MRERERERDRESAGREGGREIRKKEKEKGLPRMPMLPTTCIRREVARGEQAHNTRGVQVFWKRALILGACLCSGDVQKVLHL
jgi:hypothetical protein